MPAVADGKISAFLLKAGMKKTRKLQPNFFPLYKERQPWRRGY